MDIFITAMREQHLDPVAEIERDLFPDPWSRAMFFQDLQACHALSFVALQGGHVAGYVCSWLAADECTINRIACRRRSQRCGIGSFLLHRMFHEALKRGARSFFLDVRDSNAPARSFYAKTGFGKVGMRTNYYGDTGEDAIVMSRRFSRSENNET